MSITHRFKFESFQTEEEILNGLLLSNIGLQQAKFDQMKAEGLFSRVSEISKISQKDFLEEYNFQPSLSLSFDEDSDGDVEKGRQVMGRAVALVLKQERGDAMFFYVVDTPILKRINGSIQVAEENWYQWLRDGLDEFGLEYEKISTEAIMF